MFLDSLGGNSKGIREVDTSHGIYLDGQSLSIIEAEAEN